MQTILAAGLERLYALDWIGVTQETKDATITDYLAEVHAAVQKAGGRGRVNLVGDCQGGWLAAIYAALHPERVNTLTIAGAPIDFHAGGAVIHESVEALSDDDLSFFRALVRQGNGVLKGEFLLGGFIVIKPENEVGKQLQLLAHVRDAGHVERYRAFEDWFKHTQDIAGPFYLWLVEHLFRDNELIGGTLRIGDDAVDLGRIDCPVNLLAGATDHITPPEQVFALADAVSTPAERITRRTTSGGHLGLFMGTEALRDHWPVVMASVLEHSRPGADGARARGRARSRTAAGSRHSGALAASAVRGDATAAPGAHARRRRGRPRAAPGADGRSGAGPRGRPVRPRSSRAPRRPSSRPVRTACRPRPAGLRRSRRAHDRTARAGRARSARGTDWRCRRGSRTGASTARSAPAGGG